MQVARRCVYPNKPTDNHVENTGTRLLPGISALSALAAFLKSEFGDLSWNLRRVYHIRIQNSPHVQWRDGAVLQL